MIKKFFLPLWILGALSLFLYSYTQVDLSLTLSKASIFQDIERSFQYIGWFARPLSTYIYVGIFVYLFLLYFFSVRLVKKSQIPRRTVWITIVVVVFILTLSCNAFSYDLFNYIFDAKIVTHYFQNPYIHKALDFPNDPMLSFMHWTHRVYPYGPIWLVLTIPVSFLGSQIFIVTFFLFKILISSFFVLSAWSTEKIAKNLNLKNTLLPLVAFSLNPYVITESIVSSHNDIVMMGLFMLGFYFLLKKSNLKGWVFVLLSIGTKFATIFPAILFVVLKAVNKQKFLVMGMTISMILAVIFASLRTTYQPWYFLYVIPFACLDVRKKYVFFPLLIASIANIIFYIPFLYTGNWDPPVPEILNYLILTTVGLSIIVGAIFIKSRES